MRIHRLSVVGLAVVAMLAVTASSAFAASGPGIKAGGAFLTSAQTRLIKAVSTTESLLRTPKLNLNLKTAAGNCTVTGTVRGSGAGESGTGENGLLKCVGVQVEGAESVCTAHSGTAPAGTIESNSLKGKTVWLNSTGEAAGFLFEPTTSGGEFTKIIVEGASCSVAGEYPVTNQEIGKLLPVATEVETGEIVFPEIPKASCVAANAVLKYWSNASPRTEVAATQLSVLKQPATFCGKAEVFIVNSKGEKTKEKIGVFAH